MSKSWNKKPEWHDDDDYERTSKRKSYRDTHSRAKTRPGEINRRKRTLDDMHDMYGMLNNARPRDKNGKNIRS